MWNRVVLCLVAQSCPTLCDPMDCRPPGSSVHGDSPGKNTGVASLSLLQGIFPTQGLNPGFPHHGKILHCLSHQGSPRILEWVAYPFSRGTSWPRNWTGVSCIADRFFTSWATWEAMKQGTRIWITWVCLQQDSSYFYSLSIWIFSFLFFNLFILFGG